MRTLPTQLAAVEQHYFKLRYELRSPALGRQRPAKRCCRWCPPGSLPGFGSERSEIRTSTTKEWCMPSKLLPCNATDQAGNTTVYTVRLTTSFERGSALSEPFAGVSVCLISEDGRGVLRRISPVNDPQENKKAVEDICSIVGEDSGADCASLGSADLAPAWPNPKQAGVKPRFQEGSVDEVSFMAPDLGSLAAILVAPEGGSWVCDEVDVFSSRSKQMDRFVCRKRLGGRKGDPAAYLTPVPPGAVIYGSGDTAKVMTKEQAAVLQAISMEDYGDLKSRLLLTTALLTVGGSGVAAIASGMDAAVPFALGGVLGLLYQLLLQFGADAAVSSAAHATSSAAALDAYAAAAARSSGAATENNSRSAVSTPTALDLSHSNSRLLRIVGSSAVRLLLLVTAAFAAVWAVQDRSGKDAGDAIVLHFNSMDAWQLGLGLCGFMMYKVAVLGVSLAPRQQPGRDVPTIQQQVEKNV